MDFAPIYGKRRGAFYVTTPLTADQFGAAMNAAANQDAAVLAIFRRHHGQPMTPSRVHAITTGAGKRWPITSVRRSITTLAKDGLLAKTDATVIGPQGSPEHAWKLP